ncbi:MAG TPA: transglutaminase-like domain-containing protein [Syntrophales bacterium]|nr:transglutaminase-like domain-containing protein [Syntrophales bacterium]HQB14627.1 transglutaminase-like domain-containing protein [Syntrophales bacterium]HQK78526.1 transglutaminase-like domain-containing protein [Syntrophales bacterium]
MRFPSGMINYPQQGKRLLTITKIPPAAKCSGQPAGYLHLILVIVMATMLINGCTARYFRPASPPTDPCQIKELGNLPERESWHGFVFNGEKVGFLHMKIEPVAGAITYRVTAEANLRIRFLGLNKKIIMKSVDIVNPDLTLVSFLYEQDVGEKKLILTGAVAAGSLSVEQRSGGVTKKIETILDSPLYPSSVINLYPVLQGMKLGTGYKYSVYDPQTQSIAGVSQSIVSFEESRELDLEPAFKVETGMLGHTVSSWINCRGETIFELGMSGVLITFKESEENAKSFLAEASLSKKDLIYDFSVIKTDKPITCPRTATTLEAAVAGISGLLPPLRESYQEVVETLHEGKTVRIYRIRKTAPMPADLRKSALPLRDRSRYLAPSGHIESDSPEIRKAAAAVVSGTRTPREKVVRLAGWVAAEVRDEAVDSYSALEVLHNRRGECKAHTMLYTAMARAAGIPSRVVGGIVYMEGMGFLYHAWAESYLDGWIAVDPTFNQVGVDATHIKLADGQDWSALIQLSIVIGRIGVTIHDFSCPP